MKKKVLFFSLFLAAIMLFMVCSCKHHSSPEEEVRYVSKSALSAQCVSSDTLFLPFLFYPERWFVNEGCLYVLNSKADPFLSIYNVADRSWLQWGQIGNGPMEFLLPSLCEMKVAHQIGVYSNTLNRLDVFQQEGDTLEYLQTFKFPLWNEKRGIPKAYTRMVQYDDSLFVGTSFMPREISVELLDLKNCEVIDEAVFSIHPLEEEYSGPYECKVSVCNDYMVAAYRYINRLDVFRISPKEGFKLLYVIGDGKSQYDLYRQDRDAEMIYYYSDVVCGKEKIYALYQGVETDKLSEVTAKLDIYTLSGEAVQTFDLGRSIEHIVVDERSGIVYAYNRNEEGDIVYCYNVAPAL